MNKLSGQDKSFMSLILRSPNRGDGWRTVSDTCWPLVVMFTAKDLIEVDEENKRVRLSPEGETIAMYM